FDTISENNLQRQVLYNTNEIGKYKVEVAVQKLSRQNPNVKFITYCTQITNKNAIEIIKNYDIVVDGTDNFSTRYLINDACEIEKKPLVFGAIHRFEGQITVFNYKKNNESVAINYRDLFPNPPSDTDAFNCSDIGVIGVLPGIIGTLQATEVLKIITGVGNVLSGELLFLNALEMQFYTFQIFPDATRKNIGAEEYKSYDYGQFCTTSNQEQINEINCDELRNELLNNRKEIQLIDIRDNDELPRIKELEELKIPLVDIIERVHELDPSKKIILICKSGIRSKIAIQMLHKKFGTKHLFSLKGGITEWGKKNQ
ncbi:MAG: ThiF family adenylyltransferase, partial [Bacteroidia bacterium]|nr:ThiF family adenylyltransferase [Bacteroidia bacterium]